MAYRHRISPRRHRGLRYGVLLFILAPLVPSATPAGAASSRDETLTQARELLAAERPEEAMQMLDHLLAQRPKDPEALLLRSNARFMIGETAGGAADLDRALALDPTLRQAWLNRAAFDLSEGRFEAALRALVKARDLAPEEPDNDLNIGAVLLLQGKLDDARGSFANYLRRNPDSAESYYLVATNYAMAGEADLAVEHLGEAIRRDERVRLRARTDANFADLALLPEFQALLDTDRYRPPPGAWTASRVFQAPYRGSEGPLLKAVLDTLQLTGRAFDRRIEVTPAWALIWSDLRIKVSDTDDGQGRVELVAPATAYGAEGWRRESEELFGQINVRLGGRKALGPPKG